MFDSIVINIAAVTLMLIDLLLLRYLWKKLGCSVTRPQISPTGFLVAAGFTLAIGGALTAAVGIQGVGLSAGLAFGAVLSFIHPTIAISFFTANLIVRPWEIIPENPILVLLPRLFAALCLLSWLLNRIKTHRYSIVWNRTCSLFCAFLAWLFISAIVSGDAFSALQFFGNSFLPIVVLGLLILNTCNTSEDLNLLQAVLIAAITGLISAAIYYTVTAGIPRLTFSTTLYGNANDLAALIALAMPFVMRGIFASRGIIRLTAMIAIASILLYGLWLSQSRGAILALLVAGFTFFIFSVRLSAGSLLGLIMAALVSLTLMLSIKRDAGDMEGSSESRWNYAVVGMKMVRSNPLFGVGLNNYPVKYDSFTSVFTEYGQRTAHSSWVLVMAENGLPGLFIFLLLFLSILRTAFQLRGAQPELLLSLVSYGWTMSFLSHTYLTPPYLLFSLIVAARRISNNLGPLT